MSYGEDLAAVHHLFFSDVAVAAARFLTTVTGPGLVVDLGSGSGVLARELSEAGYDVVGFDISPDMVALATREAPKARFVCQSLHDAELPSGCTAVTSIGECMNYLFDPAASIEGVFARVRAALAPGGVFLFDLAGPGRGPSDVEHDSPEYRLVMHAVEEGGVLTRDIALERGGRRTRERHVLRLYDPADVEAALGDMGFHVRRLEGYNGFRFRPGWTGFLATVPG